MNNDDNNATSVSSSVSGPRNEKRRRRLIPLAFIFLLMSVTVGIYIYSVNSLTEDELLGRRTSEDYYTAFDKYYTPPTATPRIMWTPGPDTETPVPSEPAEATIRPEFLELMQLYDNPDIVGYIDIEGTSASYIVVQSDNNEYYLERNIYRQYSSAGWVFMDYENNIEKEDFNTIIYGHNMRADIMFHSLRYYANKNYYDEHKYITLSTLYEEQVWEIFSVFIADTDTLSADYINYIKVRFKDYDEFYEMAKEMKSRSLYDTGVELKYGDRVLNLSTCTGATDRDTRYVVSARLVEVVENEP